MVYRVLLAGRLAIACLISARSSHRRPDEQDAMPVVLAGSLLLRHIANSFPIALGASEVFDETCRGELCLRI